MIVPLKSPHGMLYVYMSTTETKTYKCVPHSVSVLCLALNQINWNLKFANIASYWNVANIHILMLH